MNWSHLLNCPVLAVSLKNRHLPWKINCHFLGRLKGTDLLGKYFKTSSFSKHILFSLLLKNRSFCTPYVCIHWAIPEKIHIIPRMAFRNSKGKGGSLNWKSEGMEDTYDSNSKARGHLQTDKSLFLKNTYFIDWFSWQMDWQHWQNRVQYKHQSIRQSVFLCSDL